jgi:solute carrier family 41
MSQLRSPPVWVHLFSMSNLKSPNLIRPFNLDRDSGDFLTMSLLAYTSRTLFVHMDKPFIQSSLLVILLLLTPVWAYAARRSKFTKSLVLTGFAPICGAMLLQITGGLIMEHALSQFKKLAPLQPVVNGVGGNLVAIQCSRMATYLHRTSHLRTLPSSDRHWLIPPWHVFTSSKSTSSLSLS